VKDRQVTVLAKKRILITHGIPSTKIAVEAQHGLIAQVVKDIIFSMRPAQGRPAADVQQISNAVDNAMAIG
jgi:COP9 signalosome complex subunit 5